MVYSPPNNDQKSQLPLADSVAHLVAADIDIGATRLQPPKIRSVHGRKATGEKRRSAPAAKSLGPITVWETPYNRPAFETPENVQYTRLALQYLQQGRIEDAERLYKQALVVAERTFPETDSAVFRAIEDLAGFYFAHERYQQAEPLVARLLKHRIDNLPCDDWLLIRTVDQLAEIYEKCGQPLNAQSLYKLLLARQEDVVGRKSLVCAFTLSRLAESYLRQEHFQAAETLMLTILEIQESAHGRCSIEISTTLQELASIYHKLGRIDKAAEMLERLLHVLETIHGDCGLSVASCLLKLADLLTEVGMTFEAEPLYRRAQDIYRISYGDTTAAHSVIKRKLERVSQHQISKASKDKPRDQEECARFPALRLNLDDMLPSKLGTGQVNRCLGHFVSAESTSVQPAVRSEPPKTMTISGADPLLDSLFVVYADSVDVSISTSEWCLTDELVRTENLPVVSTYVSQSNGIADTEVSQSLWHQAGVTSNSFNGQQGIDTLKLPALGTQLGLNFSPSHSSETSWTGTETIEFETPLWSMSTIAQPPAPPEVFAAFTGSTLEFHAPRHMERVAEPQVLWQIAGSNSNDVLPAPRPLEQPPSKPNVSLLHAALTRDSIEFHSLRPTIDQSFRQSSPWHQVGAEPSAVDPGRAFETLKLPALSEAEPGQAVSEHTRHPGVSSQQWSPLSAVPQPVQWVSEHSHEPGVYSKPDSALSPVSEAVLGMPELAPPLQQVYAETYSVRAEQTTELIPPAVLESALAQPTVLSGEKTAEMVPPAALPWTSQNYITGLLENLTAPSALALLEMEETVEPVEFVETREGIVDALKGMTVTLLETSANIAMPIDTSPPAVLNQNPDSYFEALIDEIAGSPPAPLQRVSKGALIQSGADVSKPSSMKTTTRMPYLDPQRASHMLRPYSTNSGGEVVPQGNGAKGRAPASLKIVSFEEHESSVPEDAINLPAVSPAPSMVRNSPEAPFVSKTTLQLERLSANKHAKAVAQRNPLANSLGAKATQADLAPATLIAPESLASALSARTQSDLSSMDDPSKAKSKLSPLSKVKAAITSKMPAIDRAQTPAQQRETVKESPLMAPQTGPRSKRKSTLQTMNHVSAPHRGRY